MEEKQIGSLYRFYEPLKGSAFLTGKAGSFSGVPKRTVQYWTERNLITPEIADTTGTGSKRLYSTFNCIEIGIIKSLADSRLPIKLIRSIMTFLRKEPKDAGGVDFKDLGGYNTLEVIMSASFGYLMVPLSDKIDEDSDKNLPQYGVSLGYAAGPKEKGMQMGHIAGAIGKGITDRDKMIVINITHITKRILEAIA